MDDVFQVRILTSQQLLTNNIIIMKYKKWTEERCIEIIKVMNQYPDNLRAGFEECAKNLEELLSITTHRGTKVGMPSVNYARK